MFDIFPNLSRPEPILQTHFESVTINAQFERCNLCYCLVLSEDLSKHKEKSHNHNQGE